LEKQKCDTLI